MYIIILSQKVMINLQNYKNTIKKTTNKLPNFMHPIYIYTPLNSILQTIINYNFLYILSQ